MRFWEKISLNYGTIDFGLIEVKMSSKVNLASFKKDSLVWTGIIKQSHQKKLL